MFACDSTSNDVANHDDPSGNADAALESSAVGTFQLHQIVDDRECRVNRTFRCILLGLWVTKIGEHAIAQELGDKAIEPSDCASACILVAPDQRAHFFRVKCASQCGRTHQVGKQYCDLASFRFLYFWCSRRCFWLGRCRLECRECSQEFPAMSKRKA